MNTKPYRPLVSGHDTMRKHDFVIRNGRRWQIDQQKVGKVYDADVYAPIYRIVSPMFLEKKIK